MARCSGWAGLLVLCVALAACSDSDSTGTGGGGATGGSSGTAGAGGMGGEGGAPPLDATFKAAACVRDITPVSEALASEYEATFGATKEVNHEDPVYLAGFGTDRQATGYNDRVWARGIVFAGPGGRVAIVSVDVIGYFRNETETLRAMISPDSGIDYAVISSTHQHEGPDTMGLWGASQFQSGADFGYLDYINETVADCIDEAAANLEEARLRSVTTTSEGLSLGIADEDDGFGVADGKVLEGDEELAPETEGRFVDPRLSVLQVTGREMNGDGEYDVLATLVNFASHPESLGSNNTLVTSDFPHYARVRLEEEYGGVAVWVSGAVGVLNGPLDIDVLDPDTSMPAPRRTFRFAEVHGIQLAERVIEAIDPTSAGDDAPEISHRTTTPVPIQLDNPFFRFAGALGVLGRRTLFTDGEPDDSEGTPLPPPFDTIPQVTGEGVHTEVGAIRIGDASIAVVPTELDPQRGEDYRMGMVGADHTFIVGLGNDQIGYQVPADKFDESCQVCFPYLFQDIGDECPIQPIDCGTVFQNNVGQQVDVEVSEKVLELIDELH
ncbi:MAG: neutral/alkaline non-lysosomal ceramidase N-terminal domain-containing protein [Myxococcota bacterium]